MSTLDHAVKEYKIFDKDDSEDTRADFSKFLEKIMTDYDLRF